MQFATKDNKKANRGAICNCLEKWKWKKFHDYYLCLLNFLLTVLFFLLVIGKFIKLDF